MLYFEDFAPGLVLTAGPQTVTSDLIAEFERRVGGSTLGREACTDRVSGFLVLAIAIRLMTDVIAGSRANQGSPGLESVRFLRPVLEGDSLWFRMVVHARRVSRTKPHLGVVMADWTLTNRQREEVAFMRTTGIMLRRESVAKGAQNQ